MVLRAVIGHGCFEYSSLGATVRPWAPPGRAVETAPNLFAAVHMQLIRCALSHLEGGRGPLYGVRCRQVTQNPSACQFPCFFLILFNFIFPFFVFFFLFFFSLSSHRDSPLLITLRIDFCDPRPIRWPLQPLIHVSTTPFTGYRPTFHHPCLFFLCLFFFFTPSLHRLIRPGNGYSTVPIVQPMVGSRVALSPALLGSSW